MRQTDVLSPALKLCICVLGMDAWDVRIPSFKAPRCVLTFRQVTDTKFPGDTGCLNPSCLSCRWAIASLLRPHGAAGAEPGTDHRDLWLPFLAVPSRRSWCSTGRGEARNAWRRLPGNKTGSFVLWVDVQAQADVGVVHRLP